MSYRSINFRDGVLWAITRKFGWDPIKDLQDDRAAAYVSFINSSVRRRWDLVDSPEWTTVHPRNPDVNHNVPYSDTSITGSRDLMVELSRILKVYLADPNVTPGPIDTPFRLREQGIHVGFEHGTTVWIKSLSPAPIFTSDKWNSQRNYQKGELVYSPISGECYKSLVNANVGNNPANTTSFQRNPPPPPPLATEVTQSFIPAQPAVSGASEIWSARVDVPNVYQQAGVIYGVRLTDTNGLLYKFSYTTPGAGGTVADLLAGLSAAITGLPASLTGMIITTDVPTATLTLELAAAAFSMTVEAVTSLATVHFPLTHPSSYIAGFSAQAVTPLKTIVYMDPINESLPTQYVLNLLDATGAEHIATYDAPGDQPITETVTGIQDAINTAALTDSFWGSVVINASPGTAKAFDISTPRIINIQATAQPMIIVFWALIPFPLALADEVVDDVVGDALKEEGQTDKGQAEKQVSMQTAGERVVKNTNQTFDPLTDQQTAKSRYRQIGGVR